MHDLRRNYQFASLRREQLSPLPIDQFCSWHEELKTCDLPDWFESNAMTLSTMGVDDGVSSRIVLLKAVSNEGFCFFTNYRSRKARQLESHPRAALNFYWPMLERQVRVEGIVSKTSAEVSDGYFNSRPFFSRLAAIVSPQSKAIDESTLLEQEIQTLGRSSPMRKYLVPSIGAATV